MQHAVCVLTLQVSYALYTVCTGVVWHTKLLAQCILSHAITLALLHGDAWLLSSVIWGLLPYVDVYY